MPNCLMIGHHFSASAPHAVALLRPRRERPNRRAAECSDEFAPSKAEPHLALPCQGTLWRQNSTAQACGPHLQIRGRAGLERTLQQPPWPAHTTPLLLAGIEMVFWGLTEALQTAFYRVFCRAVYVYREEVDLDRTHLFRTVQCSHKR